MFEKFDILFCVNLDTRPDRWKQAQEEFSKLGILDKVIRQPGGVYTGFEDRRRNAAYGNHMAHAECIKKAKLVGARNCFIFEDDVEFFYDSDYTNRVLSTASEHLPSDWGLFYLGINMDAYYAHPYARNLVKLDGGFSTHAYAVNEHLFDELIEGNLNKDIVHNDVWYANVIMQKYKCFVTNPLLAGQRDSFSDIQGTRMSSNEMFKQRFRDRLLNE